MTLTTQWQNVANYVFQPGTGFSAVFYLDAKYSVQSKTNNTTTIQTRLTCDVTQGSGGGNGYGFSLSYANSREGSTYWGFEDETILTGEGIVVHNDDGTKSITLSASMRVNYTGLNASMSATVDLPSIARYPLITSAPNFNDEENPTISFTTSLGFPGAVVETCLKTDPNGNPLIPYRQVNVADGNYTFNLTQEERNILRNATPNSNNLTIYFMLRTTTSGSTYMSTSQKTMTIVNANPTIGNVSATETNNKLVDLLGSSANTIVKNASVLSFSIPFSIYKYATSSSMNIREGIETNVIQSFSHSTPTSPDTFTNVQVTGTTNSGKFIYKITDSRGNVGTQTDASRTVLEYKQVNITNYSLVRQNPTSSNIILNLEATYYQQTFGSTPNVPTVKWKLDDGTYTTIPSTSYSIDTTNNKLTITDYELTNALVYTSNGTFTITIEDLLTSDSEAQEVLKGVPTYDAGEHDLQVNGYLYVADQNGENKVSMLEASVGRLLWTNQNTSEAWSSSRQITLSSSDYDCYRIVYFTGASSSTSGVKSTGLIPKGKTTQLEFLYNAGNGNNNAIIRRREFAYNDDTHYTVSANMGADGNYACRPWYVIGYKTELF